eukprot:scaffold309_cov575-Prasinococcus_capsulatus_cf.AAC.2
MARPAHLPPLWVVLVLLCAGPATLISSTETTTSAAKGEPFVERLLGHGMVQLSSVNPKTRHRQKRVEARREQQLLKFRAQSDLAEQLALSKGSKAFTLHGNELQRPALVDTLTEPLLPKVRAQPKHSRDVSSLTVYDPGKREIAPTTEQVTKVDVDKHEERADLESLQDATQSGSVELGLSASGRGCKHTKSGRTLVADDDGRVCTRKQHVDRAIGGTGCCPVE